MSLKINSLESLAIFIEEMNYNEETKGMLLKTAQLAYDLGRMSEIKTHETALDKIYAELHKVREENCNYYKSRGGVNVKNTRDEAIQEKN